MADKQTTMTGLREQYQWWDQLANRLGESELLKQQLPENWSIKDVFAHLAMWQKRSIIRLEAAMQGDEPHYPEWPKQFDPEAEGEPDELNAWLYAQRRDTAWPEVYQEWRDGFEHFLRLSDATPDEVLADKGRFAWLDGYALIDVLEGSLEHHREHAENLEPVLSSHS